MLLCSPRGQAATSCVLHITAQCAAVLRRWSGITLTASCVSVCTLQLAKRLSQPAASAKQAAGHPEAVFSPVSGRHWGYCSICILLHLACEASSIC